MRISTKLFLHTVSIVVLSVLITSCLIGWMAIYFGTQALENKAKNQLVTIRDIKQSQLQDYFAAVKNQVAAEASNPYMSGVMAEFKQAFSVYLQEIKARNEDNYKKALFQNYLGSFSNKYKGSNGNSPIHVEDIFKTFDEITFALQYAYIIKNPYPIEKKSQLNIQSDKTIYSEVHQTYHPEMRHYVERFGFHDMMLIDAETGYIVYSMKKGIDFSTSLKSGPFANTHVGEIFRKVVNATSKNFVAFSDFSPYFPSFNALSAFVGSPIYQGNIKIGVMILEIPITKINNIMTSDQKWKTIGLGDSGESYLVGSDYKMRSASRFFIENSQGYFQQLRDLGYPEELIQKMILSKTSIGSQIVQTEAVKKALQGKTGYDHITDYRGVKVLSAYMPVQIKDLNWVILSEIDEAEAFRSITELKKNIISYSIVIMLTILTFAIALSSSIIKSFGDAIDKFKWCIVNLTQSQDLTYRFPIDRNDEFKDMANSLNHLICSLQRAFQETIASGKKIQQVAEKLSHAPEKAVEIDDDNIEKGEKNSKNEKQSLFNKDNIDNIEDVEKNLNELSEKLEHLSKEFKIFEDEADRASGW